MINFLLSQRQPPITVSDPAPGYVKAPSHHFGSYENFLRAFQDQGYQFCFFSELNQTHRQLALRHDIDFDTNFALESAYIEHQLGIRSTYFFLLRSNFYNIFSPQDFQNIQTIHELGHQISVHFDPSIYEDFHQGLKTEVQLFSDFFKQDVRIISLHRPNAFFQEYDAPIFGIEHTYQSKYFRQVKYISDSTGVWRFGHPFDTPEFAQRKSIHLLIHPIWWMLDGGSNLEKLSGYYQQRVHALKTDFSNNCIPFRKINETL